MIRAIACAVILAVLYSAMPPAVFAAEEKFSVVWCFKDFNDISKVEVEEPLVIDLPVPMAEIKKAQKVGDAVIDRELRRQGPDLRVVFVREYARKSWGTWYLRYKWEYAGELDKERKLNRTFDIKINFRKKFISHSRSKDDQYSGPTPKTLPGP